MKFSRLFSKFISAMICCLLIFQGVSAFAFFSVKVTKNNTEFALKTAEIVSSDSKPVHGTQPASVNEMLRILGKTSRTDCNFARFGASAAVVNSDGRFLLQFNDKNSLNKCLARLNSDPSIIYAEKDRLVYTCASESEKDGDLSWGVDALGVGDYADRIEYSPDANVTVAIVDSGVAPVDFVKDKLVEGYDFVENKKGGAVDESIDSHGTFLASIVADCVKDAAVSIMPVRVLSSQTGSLVNAVNGIYYAADNGADVINVSLGGVMNNCRSLDDAVAYAESKNVSVVVCAGNSKQDIYNYCPAHNESAITVTAVDSDLEFAADFIPDSNSVYGSNFGKNVDVCAPGVNIIGYGADGNKKILSGTSMSAAFVSACAALVRLENPGYTSSKVQEKIKESCTDLGDEGFDVYYGYGLPDMTRIVADTTPDNPDDTPDDIPPAAPQLTGVSIKTLPEKTKYTYKVDGDIDLKGLTIEAKYSDGSTVIVADTSKMNVSGYSATTAGEQTVTVEYEGFSVRYSVTVEYTWWQWIIRILLLGFLWY